jgi:hypothetical protein
LLNCPQYGYDKYGKYDDKYGKYDDKYGKYDDKYGKYDDKVSPQIFSLTGSTVEHGAYAFNVCSYLARSGNSKPHLLSLQHPRLP